MRELSLPEKNQAIGKPAQTATARDCWQTQYKVLCIFLFMCLTSLRSEGVCTKTCMCKVAVYLLVCRHRLRSGFFLRFLALVE